MKKDEGVHQDSSDYQHNMMNRASLTQIYRQARKDASLFSQRGERLRRQVVQGRRLLTVAQEGVVFLLT